MNTPDDNTANGVNIMILGGWSPGPLPYLTRGIRRNCHFYQPNIPMPPVGCTWCCDKGFVALLAVLALMSWSCHAVGSSEIGNRALIAVARFAIVVGCLILIRFCIAWIVRGSVQTGISKARALMQQHEIGLIIGFSFGGAVVAEMVRRGIVGNHSGQPKALLLAPTTAWVCAAALQRDSSLEISVGDERRVHVYHASNDEFFCPHAQRWEQSGVHYKLVHDCHIFVNRGARMEIAQSLVDLIQLHTEERQ